MKQLFSLLSILMLFSIVSAQNPYSPNKYQYTLIDGGSYHTVALRCDGTVLCWGDNSSGQLGNNNAPVDANLPVQVSGPGGVDFLVNVIAIDAGGSHTLALLHDSTVWAWGSNTSGQLGNNSFAQSNYPVQVHGVGGVGFLTGVVSIAAGGGHSMAILADGTVVAWGNNQGQLGDLSSTNRSTPVYMQGLDYPAIDIAAGGEHSIVLQNNGTAKTCGDDFYGQLGNDQSSDKKDFLVYVADDNGTIVTGITGIAAGESHSLALLNTGTVLSWGDDSDEQIGRSTQTPKRKVALPLNLGVPITTAVAISTGANHCMALLADSTLVVWGSNDYGELGLGTTTDNEYPTALSLAPYNVLAIATGVTAQGSTGGTHTIAFIDNDSAMCWGLNNQGQLGIGITGGTYNTPQPVTDYYLGTIYADAGPDQFYCSGDSVQIGGESPGDYSEYVYQWSPTIGLTGGTISTTRPDTLADPWSVLTTPAATTINYTLIKNYRYDSLGGCVVPDTCKIDVRANALAKFTASSPACVNEGVNFINTGSSGSGVTYLWDFGSGASPSTSTMENPMGIAYSTPGLKLISMIVSDSVCGGYDIFTDGIMVYDNPVASFTASTALICQGSLVNFINTGSSGPGWVYSWDFGAGAMPATSTSENPGGIMYSTPGVKTITFTISNGQCTHTVTSTITVSETPVADFVSTAPQCTGLNVDFTNTGSSGGTWTYSWDFGTGASPATSTMENPVGIVYATAGVKLIKLVVTNGICTDSIIKTIDINQLPAVSWTSTAPVCQDAGVNFTNTGATGSGWTYLWDFGAGALPQTSATENPTGVMYAYPGTKSVTLTISNGYCTETYTNTITINETPMADFTSTAPECTGLAVDFTNTGSTGGTWTYSWNFGAGATPSTSTMENPTGIVYSTAGTKLVTLTITNGTCTHMITKPIDINLTPTVSFTSNAPVCQDAGVAFTNTGSTGSQWTYFWDFGAGAMPATSTAENPTNVMFATPGTKTITFSISNGYCTETYTNTITINETPSVDFTSTAPQCTGLPVDFTNTGSTGGTWTYSWDFGSGATPATSTLENPTGIVYSTAGNKLVTLTITDGTCSNTITKSIDINQTPSVSFTHNAPVCMGDHVNFTNTGSTGSNWSYIWDFGTDANPKTSSSENPMGISYLSGGNKTVTFTIYDGYCIATHTDTLSIYELPVANAGLDTTICADRSVQIGSQAITGYTYIWFPSSTLSNASISDPIASPIAEITTYNVLVTNPTTGCQNLDSITVTMLPPLKVLAGQDVEICHYDSVQIGAALIEGQNYLWTPAAGLSDDMLPSPMASPDQTTTYTLTVTGSGCDPVSDEVTVIVHPLPDAQAGPDDTITTAESTQLFATGGVQYVWNPVYELSNPFIYNPIASPDQTTDYVVFVTDIFGCENSDTVTIVVYDVDDPYWVPNAFTPNGDSWNDILYVRGVEFSTFEFTIYNRYGELLFISRTPEKGWDGRHQKTNEMMPGDGYFWHLNATTLEGEHLQASGIVNLVR